MTNFNVYPDYFNEHNSKEKWASILMKEINKHLDTWHNGKQCTQQNFLFKDDINSNDDFDKITGTAKKKQWISY